MQLDEGVYVQGIVTGVDIDPESLRTMYEKGPVPAAAVSSWRPGCLGEDQKEEAGSLGVSTKPGELHLES